MTWLREAESRMTSPSTCRIATAMLSIWNCIDPSTHLSLSEYAGMLSQLCRGLAQDHGHTLRILALLLCDLQKPGQHLLPPLQPLICHHLGGGICIELVVQHHIEAIRCEVAHLQKGLTGSDMCGLQLLRLCAGCTFHASKQGHHDLTIPMDIALC